MSWVVSRDGKTVSTHETDSEAFAALHRLQPHSAHHATTYEGWNIRKTNTQSCRACDGRGGVYDGPGQATECDVCSGHGSVLIKKCVECEREFNLDNDNDHAEWLYGHDCEA